MDYRSLYEDVLRMESRAREAGFIELIRECYEFRVDILLRFYSPIGYCLVS